MMTGGFARRVGPPVARFVGQQVLVAFGVLLIFLVTLGVAFVLAAGTWLARELTANDREHAWGAVTLVFGSPLPLFAFAGLSVIGFAFATAIARRLRRHETDRAIDQIGRAVAWLLDS